LLLHDADQCITVSGKNPACIFGRENRANPLACQYSRRPNSIFAGSSPSTLNHAIPQLAVRTAIRQPSVFVLIFNTSFCRENIMPRNTSVTLGEHFDKFIAEKIQQGRFQSISEAVRAGLRKLEEDELKLQVLRAKLQAGEDSPKVDGFDGEHFIAAMHKKYVK
jgi:antitoxin ParD1/3/4